MDAFTTAVLTGLVGSHVMLWYKMGMIESRCKEMSKVLNNSH